VLRFLLWRTLALLALAAGLMGVCWLLAGGVGRLLRRGSDRAAHFDPIAVGSALSRVPFLLWDWTPVEGVRLFRVMTAFALVLVWALLSTRWVTRRGRRYVRLRVEAHRTDQASAEALVRLYGALHQQLLRRWWRRLMYGQPSVALEVHHELADGEVGPLASRAWLALSCPADLVRMAEAALRTAYPNCLLRKVEPLVVPARPVVLRLKKDAPFIRRAKRLDRFEHEREPAMNGLLTVMGACRASVFLQLSLTPAPIFFERLARRRYKLHEQRISRERREHLIVHDRSMVEEAELRGGLDLQHRSLFFTEIRVVSSERSACGQVASELRVGTAENRLVERGTTIRNRLFGVYTRRVLRGEGNPLPGFLRGVFAARELASLWHMPSIDYLTVPLARAAPPLAPAPPTIMRPSHGEGMLQDALGPVSIPVELRKQNTAVPGAVEQGKTSYLIATVAEDLRRESCAVIVLDPKGDAADAAMSLVAPERTCTLLDFARPTCGFNPLAVDAPPDVIADYVVGALKNLYTDEIKASSDRYLRNAIIAVLAHDRSATLWDAARLLSVGEDGYAYRRVVAAHVRTLPELSEIATFFTSELTAQLADSRSTTTAKLDAPINKLARLLNSASIKRVLLNNSLCVDLDRVIARREVLVVKGALGLMGAGNTSVLMQLIVGMLDAALARQQDLVDADRRVTVALKVDEAPLVLNRGFAETMALKRSAGLETVACWQTDAQWTDREVRDQLDALFAHRVYFATASAKDARDAVGLTMAEFSDTVRPGIGHLSKLARPDARLYLPKHHAIASWVTHEGRQAPFIGRTVRLHVDQGRLALHAARQRERGGCPCADLRQPHWQRGNTLVPTTTPGGSTATPRDAVVGQARAHSPARGTSPSRPAGARLAKTARPTSLAAAPPPGTSALPPIPCASYRELVELDLAQSVRRAGSPINPSQLRPDALDLEMLALIARCGYVLSSQLHRHFNPQRAITTTQRRLKRLSDAAWVERFQFHRRDGGGVPMCYAITRTGRELLSKLEAEDGSLLRGLNIEAGSQREGRRRGQGSSDELSQARRDVHVTGWALALIALDADPRASVRGRAESVLSPPRRGPGATPMGPDHLRLPGGRVPHDFLRPEGRSQSVEVERFETIRPDATVELDRRRLDVMVEFDDRLPLGGAAAGLHRYDHFLTGWSAHVPRHGERRQSDLLLVFVCRDRSRARRCAQAADGAMLACQAYPGEYPQDWDYAGRSRVLFVSERDVHEGLDRAYGVARIPPAARVALSGGDPTAAEPAVQLRGLFESGELAR